jgi:DNA-binding GntR family transcriptional regulator
LHDEVVQRLRDLIVEGVLMPGERVPERQLCERFGISRTPLREALRFLASEGLVDLEHNRGARVSRLTPESVDEMFQVMEVLEGLAGRLAATRASEAQIALIEELQQQMVAHHARGELAGYFRPNQRIHECIIEAAGNPILTNIYRALGVRIRRARYMANLSPERWDQAVAEHEQILAALKDRDGIKLEQLLRAHLRHKAQVVKAVLLGAA